MKKFNIPQFYRSPIISKIKEMRRIADPRKKDYSPTMLDLGPVRFIIARHFGFCFGVENAIDIAYKTLEENPGKRIFLLSEMIHNPSVNGDLKARGVKFIMDTARNVITPWEEITKEDIVIIPAFGTSIDIENKLKEIGIDPYQYNTTCPFVEKVWNRAAGLSGKDYTVIIHGKHKHEETRATFSHTIESGAPSVVVRDLEETRFLCDVIAGRKSAAEFYAKFEGKFSEGFNPAKDLERVGVVNQTTMLASETQEIAETVKSAMLEKYGADELSNHFADTRDTLCYATNDNQQATLALLKEEADLAIVAGGYNSSNTSHLVELLEQKFRTFLISSEEKLLSKEELSCFSVSTKQERVVKGYLPKKDKVTVILTSGASCPDSVLDAILNRIISFYPGARPALEAAGELKFTPAD
jgi:4-hydroxy-3-methylbut-2-enyl diphosphate reductase